MEAKIQAMLALKEKPKDIAEKLGVNYQKVLKIRKDMQAAEEDKKVDDLISVSPVAMEMLVDKAKEEAPKRVALELERVAEGVSGLQKLDTEFHTTFSNILRRANEFLETDDLKPSEWVAITNALSNAYNNIFNNSGVNVHVDNSTNVSNSAVSMLKGALRG